MNETISGQSKPQKEKAPSPWVNVSLEHLEKMADRLKQYAKKKEAEKPAKKEKKK